jgi:hypothetical protein
MTTIFGKRMYGDTKASVGKDQGVHMGAVTVTVRQERFVSDRGSKSIPHEIAVAMADAVQWLDHAINQLTVTEYRKNERVAKAHLMIYGVNAGAPAIKAAKDDADRKLKTDAATREEITTVKGKLNDIKIGLSKNQVIKINNSGRLMEDGSFKHYLGVVKTATSRSITTAGNITIGYRAFREKQCLARILIHEAAHKYTAATDGPSCAGYWNEEFSDYKVPAGMTPTVCRNNADSHAVFVWALNQRREGVPDIPGVFEASMEGRWVAQTMR